MELYQSSPVIDRSRDMGQGPDLPADATDAGPPLSIGLFSAGWPPDAYTNGVVTYVAGVAEGLQALGHRVTIIAAEAAPGDWGDHVCDLAEARARRGLLRRATDWLWYRAAPREWVHLRGGRDLAAAVVQAIADREIEVLEMEESFGWVEFVRQAVRIPITIRLQGPWFLNGAAVGAPQDHLFRQRVAREGVAIRRAGAVTASSREVLEQTRRHYGLPLEHAEVIATPIRPIPPSDRWRPERHEPGTIFFAGRFDRHKGGDLIIEAFGRVLRAIPDARLRFAGPDRGLVDDAGRSWDLERFVDDRLPGARASGQVHLLGQQPRSALDDLRRRAAVTVICSRYDNFPATVLEAAALGCPTVAARVGGIPEIVRDGVDGLLHNAGDPDDLAAKLIAMLADPRRAAELGKQAAIRCEQEFHPIAIAARMVAHFRRAKQQFAHATRAASAG
jgi:glycosyltransferase involved in cell wall biosynthesis